MVHAVLLALPYTVYPNVSVRVYYLWLYKCTSSQCTRNMEKLVTPVQCEVNLDMLSNLLIGVNKAGTQSGVRYI